MTGWRDDMICILTERIGGMAFGISGFNESGHDMGNSVSCLGRGRSFGDGRRDSRGTTCTCNFAALYI